MTSRDFIKDRDGAVPAHPPFEVSFDPGRRQLHWTMRGFWTLDDVAAFGRAMLAAVAPLGPPPQRYDALSDARAFKVQSADVSEALHRIDDVGRNMRQGRFAVVVGSMLNKMQAERTLTSPATRVFLDMEDAQAWLDTEETS